MRPQASPPLPCILSWPCLGAQADVIFHSLPTYTQDAGRLQHLVGVHSVPRLHIIVKVHKSFWASQLKSWCRTCLTFP